MINLTSINCVNILSHLGLDNTPIIHLTLHKFKLRRCSGAVDPAPSWYKFPRFHDKFPPPQKMQTKPGRRLEQVCYAFIDQMSLVFVRETMKGVPEKCMRNKLQKRVLC